MKLFISMLFCAFVGMGLGAFGVDAMAEPLKFFGVMVPAAILINVLLGLGK